MKNLERVLFAVVVAGLALAVVLQYKAVTSERRARDNDIKQVSEALSRLNLPKLGGFSDFDVYRATSTSVQVKTIVTEVLAPDSSRLWARLDNASSTGRAWCEVNSTSTGMAVSTGFALDARGLTTSTKSYWDSSESGINPQGGVYCIGETTTTVAVISR